MALNLIDDDPIKASDKTHGVGPGSLQDRVVVQREVGPILMQQVADEPRT